MVLLDLTQNGERALINASHIYKITDGRRGAVLHFAFTEPYGSSDARVVVEEVDESSDRIRELLGEALGDQEAS